MVHITLNTVLILTAFVVSNGETLRGSRRVQSLNVTVPNEEVQEALGDAVATGEALLEDIVVEDAVENALEDVLGEGIFDDVVGNATGAVGALNATVENVLGDFEGLGEFEGLGDFEGLGEGLGEFGEGFNETGVEETVEALAETFQEIGEGINETEVEAIVEGIDETLQSVTEGVEVGSISDAANVTIEDVVDNIDVVGIVGTLQEDENIEPEEVAEILASTVADATEDLDAEAVVDAVRNNTDAVIGNVAVAVAENAEAITGNVEAITGTAEAIAANTLEEVEIAEVVTTIDNVLDNAENVAQTLGGIQESCPAVCAEQCIGVGGPIKIARCQQQCIAECANN